MKKRPVVKIIGGGLAGTEAAIQIAQRGHMVQLYEMRPYISTGAHTSGDLAELICSNSLGSTLPDRAAGVLKNELRMLGSILLECAENAAVPAGTALAVDREIFSKNVTKIIVSHPNIELIRQEENNIPTGFSIIASGPLTSQPLSQSIARLTGEENLFFYDAIAPIVLAESIDMTVAFRGSRFGAGKQDEGDYINCPFTQEQYETFVNALVSAERIKLHHFESNPTKDNDTGFHSFFEGCLPVEVIASRGFQSLAFGPMRPIGLKDPHTGNRPYAITQLRQDNVSGSLYNIVGFQTNLTYQEQKRIFRMIPGLQNVEFIRYGQMHRNTFIASPKLLLSTMQYRNLPQLFFAGQITGVEGYVPNIATGLIAGLNITRLIDGASPLSFPADTIIGSLCSYITNANNKDFQPMKANFGILPPIQTKGRLAKHERSKLYAERAIHSLERFLKTEIRL